MNTALQGDEFEARPAGGSGSAVILTLIASVAFGYFGCVKPMTEELRATRISVACLQNRVAKLMREADAAQPGVGLMARLAEQRDHAAQAAAALNEIEAVNRRLAERTRQIAMLANSEDVARRTLKQVARGRELLGAAQQALADSQDSQQRLVHAHQDLAAAATAADRMRALCDRLASSRAMVEEAHAAQDDLARLSESLVIASRDLPAATKSVEGWATLSRRIATGAGATDAAVKRVAGLEALETRLVAANDCSAEAAQSLETLSDLQADAVAAGGALRNLREVMLEVVLMQPALDRAVATLGPIRQLASLRHLDAAQLQVAAKALEVAAQPQLQK